MNDDELRQGSYHVKLTPHAKGVELNLRELWDYRYLVLILAKKTFSVTYQQTVLGPLWIIINPILSSLVYLFIFGYIARIGTAGVPQILFYFVSTAVWGLLSYSLSTNANTFITNAPLFSKVYFPRMAVPLSSMLVSLLKFCIQLAIIAVLMAVFLFRGEIHPLWIAFPLLPLLCLQMSLLGMAIGVLLSSLTTRYRDLQMVVSVGVSLWMYATPIVYPLSTIPAGPLKTLLQLNPATEIVEAIRLILLGTGEFDPAFYAVGLVLTIVLVVLSSAIFNHVQRTFEDTV